MDDFDSELHRLAADVFRVLVIDHGICWRSELEEDLRKLRNFSGQPPTSKKDVDEALKILLDKRIIEVEYRKRGDWPRGGVYVDQLLKVRDLVNARRSFEHDRLFLTYTAERQKVYDSLN